ncbi:MAG: glycine cleavage system protein GcvH [Candidatus Omnitrophica bacterium]|nr:glycine cleavage system protein GcvH [Candidatus Omnitrophota bacterium]MCF7878325.1 glycine cleavage system protein GcvH [Candidatus Omnitrophota bacterium]
MMVIYYTKNHEWAKVEENIAIVGITEYAASQLGDVVFIDLPEMGKEYKQDQVVAEIESVKAASDIYAPLSGKVTEINSKLDDSPETINNSSENEGWIAKIEITNSDELDKLINKKQYEQYLQTLK